MKKTKSTKPRTPRAAPRVNPRHKPALGRRVTSFLGFDTFPTPQGVTKVVMTSDEFTAVCPVTGQPDQYLVTITYPPRALCLESKSLKLYLQSFRNAGDFCEALSSRIAREVQSALQAGWVTCTITQKPRGGVSIVASATSPVPGGTP